MKRMTKGRMGSQTGFVTMDFIFAVVITFGMSIVLFGMTYTLSVIEVTQYVTYSAARAQAAGNKDKDAQVEEARNRYTKLLKDPRIGSTYSTGWFEISPVAQLDVRSGETNFGQDYPTTGVEREVYAGVRTNLHARILEMKLPLLGQLAEEDSMTLRVNSFLIREPSAQECRDFMRQKADAVWNLDGGRFSSFRPPSTPNQVWEDNGC